MLKLLQLLQIFCEQRLPGDLVHHRKMIDFLVRLERLQSLRVYRQVLPVQVELRERVLVLGDSPAHLASHLLEHRVVGP